MINHKTNWTSVKINLIRQVTGVSWLLSGLYLILFLISPAVSFSQKDLESRKVPNQSNQKGFIPVVVGAERTDKYLSLLTNRHVALVVNQTSLVSSQHLADMLKAQGVDIKVIFAPEHGFRGDADAGAHVNNSTDKKTGIPIISLYGKKEKPSPEDLKGIDVVVYDIQDVGCRFYTFLSTLHYVMEACAENGAQLLILDRPDPNGYYVDGPVLDLRYRSFVGISKVPVMYGLTPGEYALLAKGEKWVDSTGKLDVRVISCLNYSHSTKYKLPVAPSPNLRNERAVFLYPSLCFFEGTNVSVGRGTEFPFQVIGSPYVRADSAFEFTPRSMPGATDPPYKGQKCLGYDLRRYRKDLSTEMKGVNIRYLLKMYALTENKDKFFSNASFFDKLAGSDELRKQIIAGKTEAEIKASWQPALKAYKEMRKKYLLYGE
jgi:uncharacterized protein YbbC (DUF1343 family)